MHDEVSVAAPPVQLIHRYCRDCGVLIDLRIDASLWSLFRSVRITHQVGDDGLSIWHDIHITDARPQMSIEQLASSRGYVVYDTAIPMDWARKFTDRTGGINPMGLIVWCYDIAKMGGAPAPLTDYAASLLGLMASSI